jgi:hypothetical protein
MEPGTSHEQLVRMLTFPGRLEAMTTGILLAQSRDTSGDYSNMNGYLARWSNGSSTLFLSVRCRFESGAGHRMPDSPVRGEVNGSGK